jgi:hypothetical protein
MHLDDIWNDMNIRVRASYRADTPQRLTRDELVVYGGW